MRNFDSMAPDVGSALELTDAHINLFVQSIIKTTDDTHIDPEIFENALDGFSMPKLSTAQSYGLGISVTISSNASKAQDVAIYAQ